MTIKMIFATVLKSTFSRRQNRSYDFMLPGLRHFASQKLVQIKPPFYGVLPLYQVPEEASIPFPSPNPIFRNPDAPLWRYSQLFLQSATASPVTHRVIFIILEGKARNHAERCGSSCKSFSPFLAILHGFGMEPGGIALNQSIGSSFTEVQGLYAFVNCPDPRVVGQRK
jgi:hypothetical protein